jgi:hypothetical protein
MKKYALILMSCVTLASCSLIESLDPKTEQDKTIELLTVGGVWNVDSATWKVTTEAPGLNLTLSDSVFTNYGTWEFQAPVDVFTRYGTGYLIHRYTKKGIAKVDTMAWVPTMFGSISDNADKTLTIWFIDKTLLQREIVLDDWETYFDYKQKDKNIVRIEGYFAYAIGVGTIGRHTRKFRLSR